MNASAKDNALPGGGQAARKEKRNDNTHGTPLGTSVKRLIVGLAVWGLISPDVAHWLIGTLGLREA